MVYLKCLSCMGGSKGTQGAGSPKSGRSLFRAIPILCPEPLRLPETPSSGFWCSERVGTTSLGLQGFGDGAP